MDGGISSIRFGHERKGEGERMRERQTNRQTDRGEETYVSFRRIVCGHNTFSLHSTRNYSCKQRNISRTCSIKGKQSLSTHREYTYVRALARLHITKNQTMNRLINFVLTLSICFH